jgi:acetyl-CoA C-acetyltransferase
MSIKGKAVVAGVYEHPLRWAPHKTQYQIMAESARGALEDAGLSLKDVDGLFTSGVSGMGIVSLAEHLNLVPNFLDSNSIGGSSFVSHTGHAAAAIAAGYCDVALILYGSKWSSDRFAIGTGGAGGGDPSEQFENCYGPTTVGDYALTAQRHMHEFGTTSEQLAEIAVTMRRHASMNPLAKFRDPITVEDVLTSRLVSSPLHLLDCCMISDGGGAIVVTSAERARDLRKKPVHIVSAAETCYHTNAGMRDLTDAAAKKSGPTALARAGVAHKDINMAMIYDSFTITVLVTLESLGFCKKGEGGSFIQNGRIGLGGELPINTDGGGLSSNHPGMRGIFLVIEATKQLRGECGDRQVKDCQLAFCHGTGGTLGLRHSGASLVLSL